MGTTLSNGVYLPDEGERNCYAGLKVNWEILNQKVADISALQLAIAGALHRQIVASLPTEDIDPNTIYMILSGTSATENVYNEFMYVNNAWELIGTSATDLTNYYTKAEVDGKLLLKANASDLTSHTGDTTIHVTANDKTKWTNSANTHVLRLALSALTPSTSGNSFSNLDDSTALKVGDKVMDTAGVLFEVTAIDTQNSTFTIGTALIDLAQDSDVVHKSGNETIAGEKTFNDLHIIGYGTQYKGSRNAYILPEFAAGYSGLSITTLGISQAVKIGNFVLDANNKPSLDTSKGYIQIATGENNGVNACVLEPRNSTSSSLGASANRWSKIYGTEYYYGSNNVEFSTKFVTTDSNQTISGSKTFSSNVNVYNSDSSTDTANIVLKNSKAERGSTTNIGEQTISFLDKDNAQIGHIKCEVDSSGVSTLTLQCTNSSNSSSGIRLRRTSTGTFLHPVYNSGCNLGTNGYRWYDVQTRSINSLEPSSLSLPSGNANDVIDISSYITDMSGTANSYTAPANGWISIDVVGTAIAIVSSSWSDSRYRTGSGNVRMLYPVLKNEILDISIAGTTLAYARFIPCQGNV